MSIFSRRRAAPAPMPAPPPPAPVAQPPMINPYLRNLPAAQPQQPDLSGAMGQLRAGDNVAAQNTMRQIVGLPPLPAAPQMANPSLADAIALGKTGDQAGMQRMMQQIVGLPPSGAPQQPGMQQTIGPGRTPEGNLFNPAQPQPGFLGGIQPGQMGPMQQSQLLQPGAQPSLIGMQAQQPLMPPQTPFNGNLQDLYAALAQQQAFGQALQQPANPAANMMSNAGFGPQVSAAFGSNMQPQQPNSLGQQFGQAQNPFARPMQPGIGQSLQQSSGQTQQQPSNIMSSKFGSAFGGGTQPQQPAMQQPQQPGMQQNSPMQKAGGSTGRTGLF